MSEIIKEIKEKALDEHIPIVQDDVLREIAKCLKDNPPKTFLEIGAAVRLFCNLLF